MVDNKLMLLTNSQNPGIAINPATIVGVECYKFSKGVNDARCYGIRFLGANASLVWSFDDELDRERAYLSFITSANQQKV